MQNESEVMTDQPRSDREWFETDFEGYPIIYSITIYHMYPVITFVRVVHILWYIIGIVGNTISLRIWTLPKMRKINPSAPYLISLAICDLAYQFLHVFYYLKYFWGLSSLGYFGICQAWNVLNLVPQYASQMLVFGFTTERFIAIIWPFHGQRFRRKQRVPYNISAILTVSVVLAAPQLFFWELDNDGFCEIAYDSKTLDVYGYWSLATEILIFTLVPVTSLIFNIFVLRQTRKSHSGIERLNSSAGLMRAHKRTSSRQPVIKTLLLTSFFRIWSQLPMSVTYMLQNVSFFYVGKLMPLQQMSYDAQWQRFLQYWAIRLIIETAGALQHAFGIFVYISSSSHFKLELKRMFGFGPKNKRNCFQKSIIRIDPQEELPPECQS